MVDLVFEMGEELGGELVRVFFRFEEEVDVG